MTTRNKNLAPQKKKEKKKEKEKETRTKILTLKLVGKTMIT